jgi:S-adenosylmethionine:diacylglycerol 3-amino-3-carboxypropyl transferase
LKNTLTDRNNGFFEKINYSASNEDGDSESEALQIRNSDVVLCITGSGARTLDLLIDNPSKIYSIDFNPTQNYLLKLKMAAYQALEYEEFCEFIDVFSLSDFCSYAADTVYHDIWAKVILAANHDARFCERQFLVKREPQKIFDVIKRNREKEIKLEQIDRTAIYTFCVGQIIK